MGKLDFEEVRQLFVVRDFTLLSENYKNQNSPLPYICNKHFEKGVQYITVSALKDKRRSTFCKFCREEQGRPNRRMSEDEARKLCEERDFEFVNMNFKRENGHSKSYVQFICNKHRDKGIQEVVGYSMRNSSMCKYCSGLGKSTEDFIKEIDNPNIEVLGEYTGAFNKIKCRCKIHDMIWEPKPGSLYRGCGCPTCKIEKIKAKQTKTTEEYVKQLSEKNPNIELLEPYKTANEKLLFRCKIHKYEWMSIPQRMITFQTGCPKCQSYNNENKLYDILTQWGYNVELQKKFEDCKDKHLLPFDLYLPDFNICIEYDGEQHYQKERFEWRDSSHSSFDLTQKHDLIKTKYCLDHEIPLIRIPYWEADAMESFLFDEMVRYGAIELKEAA